MAYNTGNTSARNNAQGDTWEKADGFINFYISDENGDSIQLGKLTLRESDPSQKQIYDFLMADPARVEKLVKSLQVSFRPAKKKAGIKFNLDALL